MTLDEFRKADDTRRGTCLYDGGMAEAWDLLDEALARIELLEATLAAVDGDGR